MKAIAAVLALVLATGGAMAAETQPTSAPALDCSSPRATVRSLFALIQAGDLDALEKCGEPVTVAGERDIVRYTMADEFFQCALGRAAADRFGDEKAREWLDWQAKYKTFLADLDTYEEKIAGDQAQLVPPTRDPGPNRKTMNLRKVNGEWRWVIVLRVLDDPEYQAEVLRAGKAERAVIELLCQDIRAGKFATFEAAKAALTERRQAIPPMKTWTRPGTVHKQPVTRTEKANP